MTQLEDLCRDPFHLCHVCANRYKTWDIEFQGIYPLCCPACDAPVRMPYTGIGRNQALGLLIHLGGGTCSDYDDTFMEFRILQHVRTVAEIDALLDEVRAAYPLLDLRKQRREELPAEELLALETVAEGRARGPDDAARFERRLAALRFEVANRVAEDRVRAQIEAGVLEWRLGHLREMTVALLCAEYEHHQHIRTARGAPDDAGGGTCIDPGTMPNAER